MPSAHNFFLSGLVCLSAAAPWAAGCGAAPLCATDPRLCAIERPGEIVFSARVGAAGGHFKLDSQAAPGLAGALLEIPAGALDQEIELRVLRAPDQAAAGESVAGPALQLLPAGLRLRTLGRISLPVYPDGTPQGARRFAAVNLGRGPRQLIAGLTETTRFTIDLPATGTYQVVNFAGAQSLLPTDTELKPGLDVLFVIDNSPSMAAKQKKVMAAALKYMLTLGSYCLNYHLGVVSSNTGTVPMGGMPWKFADAKSCNSDKGDGGIMQNTSCKKRGFSGENKNNCNAVCTIDPTKQLMNTGDNYIRYYDGPDPKTGMGMVFSTNVVTGTALEAFQCISYLGDEGCGIEKPLESAQWALTAPENQYFLRDYNTSTLVLVFIGDEDDCSVAPAERVNGDPDKLKECDMLAISDPDCFDWNYRCYAASSTCDQKLTTTGNRTNCKADKTKSYLTGIDKFVNAYTAMGRKVIVAGIWPAADTPVEVIQVAAEVNPKNPSKTALLGLNRFCQKVATPDGSGAAPQNRLSGLAKEMSAKTGEPPFEADICATNFDSLFTALTDHVKNKGYCQL